MVEQGRVLAQPQHAVRAGVAQLGDRAHPLAVVDRARFLQDVDRLEPGVPDLERVGRGQLVHALAVGLGYTQRAGRAVVLAEAVVAAGQHDAGGEPLEVPLPRPRQRLVEVGDVEDVVALGGGEAAEVEQVRVAAGLDGQPADRRGRQVVRHHGGRTAVVGQRRLGHAGVADGDQVRQPVGIGRVQHRDRIGSGRRGQPERVRGAGQVLAHRLARLGALAGLDRRLAAHTRWHSFPHRLARHVPLWYKVKHDASSARPARAGRARRPDRRGAAASGAGRPALGLPAQHGQGDQRDAGRRARAAGAAAAGGLRQPARYPQPGPRGGRLGRRGGAGRRPRAAPAGQPPRRPGQGGPLPGHPAGAHLVHLQRRQGRGVGARPQGRPAGAARAGSTAPSTPPPWRRSRSSPTAPRRAAGGPTAACGAASSWPWSRRRCRP